MNVHRRGNDENERQVGENHRYPCRRQVIFGGMTDREDGGETEAPFKAADGNNKPPSLESAPSLKVSSNEGEGDSGAEVYGEEKKNEECNDVFIDVNSGDDGDDGDDGHNIGDGVNKEKAMEKANETEKEPDHNAELTEPTISEDDDGIASGSGSAPADQEDNLEVINETQTVEDKPSQLENSNGKADNDSDVEPIDAIMSHQATPPLSPTTSQKSPPDETKGEVSVGSTQFPPNETKEEVFEGTESSSSAAERNSGDVFEEGGYVSSCSKMRKTSYPSGHNGNVLLSKIPSSNNSANEEKSSAVSSNSANTGSTATNGGRSASRLSWKSDPDESFSDWKVIIVQKSTGRETIYHLHRNVLGFGPRRSEYFRREFQRQQATLRLSSSAYTGKFLPVSVTRLELDDSQAAVFPMILDFVYYTKEVKQHLTPDRACAIYVLAEYLHIQSMIKAVTDFYRKTLSLSNMQAYLTCALTFRAQRLLLVSKAKVGSIVTERPEMAGLVQPHIFADILEMSQKHISELRATDPDRYTLQWEASQGRRWSKAVSVCIDQNAKEVTRDVFDRLTHARILPAVDANAALTFLLTDAALATAPPAPEMTNLQRRCIDSLDDDDWEVVRRSFASPRDMARSLRTLPSHVLAEILAKSMKRPIKQLRAPQPRRTESMESATGPQSNDGERRGGGKPT